MSTSRAMAAPWPMSEAGREKLRARRWGSDTTSASAKSSGRSCGERFPPGMGAYEPLIVAILAPASSPAFKSLTRDRRARFPPGCEKACAVISIAEVIYIAAALTAVPAVLLRPRFDHQATSGLAM